MAKSKKKVPVAKRENVSGSVSTTIASDGRRRLPFDTSAAIGVDQYGRVVYWLPPYFKGVVMVKVTLRGTAPVARNAKITFGALPQGGKEK